MTKGIFTTILAVTLLINSTAKGIPQQDETECPASSKPLPECPDPANDPGYTFFPHPNSCEFFYHCYQGVPKCKKCPQGLVWNSELDTCDWSWNVNCNMHRDIRRHKLLRNLCPEIGGILPPCPFPDHQESTYHAHPGDCHWFYQCSNGVPYCQKCPVNLHWNAEIEVCDYPYRANCGSSGDPAPSTPNNEDSTTVASSEKPGSSTAKPCPAGHTPVCPFPDPEYSAFFPHENDCHWFYHCSNGVALCKECPVDLHWNVKLETCDYPYRAGCINGLPSNSTTAMPSSSTTEQNSSPSAPATNITEVPNPTESSTITATPLCPTGNTPRCPFPDPEHLVFFPHENDCQWFYQCANGVAHCKKCPQGLHWNDKKQICDFPENAGCTSGNPSTPALTTEGNSATDTEVSPSESPIPTQSTSAPRLCPQGHVPACPFPDPEFSVFFPHDNDCHWFYHCSNGVAYCKECPADLHWNIKLETCDYPYRAGCKTDPSSNSSTAAPPPTTVDNSSPSEPATDTTEAPIPTQSSTTSGAIPACPPGKVPQCPFPNPEYLVFLPHENDCHWFYQCANGIAHCKECPQGLHWNNHKHICDYPENAGCVAGTSSTPVPTTDDNSTPESSSTTDSSPSESLDPTQSTTSAPRLCPQGQIPSCPFPDPDFSVFFPHENDCHWFYQCSNGVAYCKECPADLHWNTNLQTCDYPYRAGCGANPPGSSTDAPPSSSTEQNSTPYDPTTDSSEAATPTQSSTTSDATPVCPSGNAPQCPIPDPEYLIFFPHENDCQWFYQCANGVAHCKQCPLGLHWNNQKQICDYPENAGCASGNPSTPVMTTGESTTPNLATDTEASSSESPNPTQSTSSPIQLCPTGREPTCPFPDPEFSVFFPHENDCHWFYHCSNGVAYCKRCPAGLHWNAKLETCDYPYRAGCANVPPPESSSPASPESTTQDNSSPSEGHTEVSSTESTQSTAVPCPLGSVPACPFPDPELSVFFPHDNDCHWFYHCSNGIAYCKECPADLHWNARLETCDYPYRAGCSVASKIHKLHSNGARNNH